MISILNNSLSMEIKCVFSEPLYWDPLVNQLIPLNGEVLKTTNWNYTQITCQATSTTSTLPMYMSEIVSTSTPEKNFYLSKTIDLGQILFGGLFLLFFLFCLVFSMKNLFHSTKIHFEK